jgi:hypothetical protein
MQLLLPRLSEPPSVNILTDVVSDSANSSTF